MVLHFFFVGVVLLKLEIILVELVSHGIDWFGKESTHILAIILFVCIGVDHARVFVLESLAF